MQFKFAMLMVQLLCYFPGTESRMTATVIAFLSGTLQDWDTLALINETGCDMKSQTNMSTRKLVL